VQSSSVALGPHKLRITCSHRWRMTHTRGRQQGTAVVRSHIGPAWANDLAAADCLVGS
jgi:hypothetical protein